MSCVRFDAQPEAAEFLGRCVESGRLPHALLFFGPEGSGQLEVSMELAKALFRRSDEERGITPPGAVHERLLEEGNHPDYRTLAPEPDARSIPIEEIRRLIAWTHLKPYQAGVKLFVIDRAESLSEVAQNALLKTLEEPPPGTYFVLIAPGPESLLETIRSRSQAVRFRPVTAAADQTDDPAVEAAKNEILETLFYRTADRSLPPDFSGLSRAVLLEVLERVARIHRDLWLLSQGVPELVRDTFGLAEKQTLAPRLAPEEWRRRLELFGEAREKIQENMNVKIVMGRLWDQLGVSSRTKG